MDTFVTPIAADQPIRHGPDPFGPLGVARAIVLVQGAVLVALTIEAAIFALAFGGGTGSAVVVTALAAGVTLATAAGLGRGARLARRWTVLAELAVLATGLVDLALSLVLTGVPAGPVVILTRIVAPLVVVGLVRQAGRPTPAAVVATPTGWSVR